MGSHACLAYGSFARMCPALLPYQAAGLASWVAANAWKSTAVRAEAKRARHVSSASEALSQAAAAMLTTLALYPLDMIKTRLNNG